ncbi:MAG: hypothetical protein ACOCRU_02610 [bacterium]
MGSWVVAKEKVQVQVVAAQALPVKAAMVARVLNLSLTPVVPIIPVKTAKLTYYFNFLASHLLYS